jgi:predicted TIM-barrel fold metal-dependent hydrolase
LLPPATSGVFQAVPFPEIVDREVAADPARTADVLFGERRVDAAVLTPLTRGLVPHPAHAAAIAEATNEWLFERWLDGVAHPFYGAIRVPLTNVRAALRAIERWAAEPRFVQIAVPLRGYAQLGDERYFPIWEAAAAHQLPVYVQDDLVDGAELPHSSMGQPVHFAEGDALRPMLAIVQLASLVTSGVMDRLPDLRFIFGDGGLDQLRPMLWRTDNDWRGNRAEAPWVAEPPSLAAQTLARFVSQAQDGAPHGMLCETRLARAADVDALLVYGSHFPYWDAVERDALVEGLGADTCERVLGGNLLDVLPRLAERAPTTA